MQPNDDQCNNEHVTNRVTSGILNDAQLDAKRYKRERAQEKKRFLTSVIAILGIVSLIALISGFCNVTSMVSADKRELARLMASIVFPMSAILTFVFTQSLNLREKLSKSKFTRPIQLIACTRMSQISTATVTLCAVIGLLSIYYYKSSVDILLSVSLYLLPIVFALLVFNVLYFYYTYYER